jgi:hypothetical protein
MDTVNTNNPYLRIKITFFYIFEYDYPPLLDGQIQCELQLLRGMYSFFPLLHFMWIKLFFTFPSRTGIY